jgi:hypothetical protein
MPNLGIQVNATRSSRTGLFEARRVFNLQIVRYFESLSNLNYRFFAIVNSDYDKAVLVN